MAFEVGAIVSKLTMNTQQWSQSVTKVEGDQTKMGTGAKNMSAKFRQAGIAMVAAGTAITAAMGSMIKKYVEAGDWVDKMSKRTGIGTEALSELAYAADLSGASLSDVEKSVKRMSGTILDAHSGLETYVRAFDQMGVSVDDLMKMNPEQQFLEISEAIATIEDPTIRAALAQDVFGRSGTALLPMMSEGAEGLQKMREEARELGIIYTTETAQSAADLKDAQTALKESFKGLSMAITEHVVPMLTKMVEGITDIIVKVKDWMRENPGLADGIAKIATVAGPLLITLGTLAISLPTLTRMFGLMKSAVTGLLSPVGLLTAALAALAIGYMRVKSAQDKAMRSAKAAAEQEEQLENKIWQAAEAAGMSSKEFLKLRDAYKGNAAALAMAIKRGKEGKELQEALTNVTTESKTAYEEHAEAVNANVTVFQGYLDKAEEVKEAEKTWLDYLKDIGIMTLQEKGDRVEELEGYLEDLHQGYKDGKLTLDDYLKAVREVKGEIFDLSSTLTTTAVPAARDMSTAYNLAVSEMTSKTSDFEVKVKEKTGGIKSAWIEASERMRDTWSRELGAMLSGAKSFKDAAGAVWNETKRMFFDMVAQMVTKWIFEGVANLVKGAKDAAGGITSTFKGVGEAVSGIGTGIGKLITTLATAIAQAATTIAAAAPAILIAAGVALAIYAGFKAISALFGGGKGQKDQLGKIVDATIGTRDVLFKDILPMFWELVARLDQIRDTTAEKLDTTIRVLRKIQGFANLVANRIGKVVSAQGGAVVTDTRLAMLHGTPSNPEIAMPASDFPDFAGAGGGTFQKSVTVNVYVHDQLDPYSAQRITRDQIVPQMLRAIEVDPSNKSELQRIMGIKK